MDSSASEPSGSGLKRKHSPSTEDGRRSAPPPPAAHGVAPGGVTPINYLSRAKSERLRLIEGDGETFGDVLAMIDDYEGVLNRHESLAANLGAKLVGPLLLKSLEKLFDGPIKVITSSLGIEHSPVSWFDVVTFARTNPNDFVLTSDLSSGTRRCRFWIKGGEVEITEDDYRLIMSGGPERMIPTQPVAEDEFAELGTLNILELRLSMLIKKADAVASKARQLNYHLKGRKSIIGRKTAEQASGFDTDVRTFSPQPFSAVNARSSQPPNGDASKLQSQLLDQYLSLDRRTSLPQSRPNQKRLSTATADAFPPGHSQEPESRRVSHPPTTASEDGSESHYRARMAAKIEKLNRGDRIDPPCDRCRRLKYECTKHLTACQACTRKHARCSWKEIKEGELDDAPRGSSTTLQNQSTPARSLPLSLYGYQAPRPSERTTEVNANTSMSENLKDENGNSEMSEDPSLAAIASAAAAKNKDGQ